MKKKPIKVGLVGCGNAARNIHMPLFLKHRDIYSVVCCTDAVAETAAAFARDFDVRALGSTDRLLEEREVELVIVLTKPPWTHRDIALKALASGKHVVVEKPMAGSDAECAQMVQAAESASRVLAVHHNRRWDLDFLAARWAIESGLVGQVRVVRNEYVAGFTGSAYDWGIHIVDQTMCLSFGRRFVELSAAFCEPRPESPLESEGFFTCRLRTEDGVIHDLSMLPAFHGSAFRPGKMPARFVIAGTEGIVYQDWCQRLEDAFVKPVLYQPSGAGRPLPDLPFVSSKLLIPDFYESLYNAIRDGGPVPVPASEGRRAVRAWELICQSACENRTLTTRL